VTNYTFYENKDFDEMSQMTHNFETVKGSQEFVITGGKQEPIPLACRPLVCNRMFSSGAKQPVQRRKVSKVDQ